MGILNKWERKFGKYALPNLTILLIASYAVGYLIRYTMPQAEAFLTLDPYYILKGQVWRLFSWIFIPPTTNLFFAIIMLSCYYYIGTSLERTWGAFRYNIYFFGGLFFTIVGAFVLYLFIPQPGIGWLFNTSYINYTLMLAFAATYPEMQFMIYFIIPVKAKWIGILDIAMIAYMFFQNGWAVRVAILSSLLNFFIFFFTTRNFKRVSPKEVRRKQVYRQQVKSSFVVTKHKCAICGRTDDDAQLEFRFCSKCEGNYEYCQDHLFTHEHVKNILK
ncbi:hypothetical protein LQZ18_01150 [Lachnospiraceae bacterium ZAX-1]